MNYKVELTSNFKKEAKKLTKKYSSLKQLPAKCKYFNVLDNLRIEVGNPSN